MAATAVVFDDGPGFIPEHRVYTRTSWDSEWEEQEHFHCDYVQFTANPDMAKAQFTWFYGRMLRPGSTEWETVEKLDNLREFIKVEIDDPDHEDTPIVWCGVLEEDNGEQKGVLASSEDGHGRGRQILVAYGLDIMLQRHVLTRSIAFDQDGSEITIARAIEFNAKAQIDSEENLESPNRSEDEGEEETFVFAHDLTTAKFWTTLDAVKYLLAYHAPPDQVDDIIIEWRLDPFRAGDLPDFDKPRKPCHGRTLRQVLDELIDRRRLLGYTVVFDAIDGGTDRVEVRTFTFTPEDVTFEGNVIPANANQKSLVFDSDTAVETAFLRKATLEAIDQVICVGERAVSCFTIDGQGETLVKHWNDSQQSAYETAASGAAGYASLDESEKERRNKLARNNERVKRVYSYFGLPSDWDGEIEGQPYFEDPDNEGSAIQWYFPQLRFQHHLPLKSDHDYRLDNIEHHEIVDNVPEGQKWEYRPPLLAIKQLGETTKYEVLNSLGLNTESPQASMETEDGYKWSASIRMQDDAPGFVMTVGGLPRHILGKTDFHGLPADDPERDSIKWDWHDLLVTLSMQVDYYAQGKWPENPAESQAVRRWIINLGDEYKLHYVVPGTVVAIDSDDGDLITTNEGGFIRDDQEKLKSLAHLAYEWYGLPRQQLELKLAYITSKLQIGDLITTVGEGDSQQTINSVVTGVKYEFSLEEDSRPGKASSSFSTQFAELDAHRFVGQD